MERRAWQLVQVGSSTAPERPESAELFGGTGMLAAIMDGTMTDTTGPVTKSDWPDVPVARFALQSRVWSMLACLRSKPSPVVSDMALRSDSACGNGDEIRTEVSRRIVKLLGTHCVFWNSDASWGATSASRLRLDCLSGTRSIHRLWFSYLRQLVRFTRYEFDRYQAGTRLMPQKAVQEQLSPSASHWPELLSPTGGLGRQTSELGIDSGPTLSVPELGDCSAARRTVEQQGNVVSRFRSSPDRRSVAARSRPRRSRRSAAVSAPAPTATSTPP